MSLGKSVKALVLTLCASCALSACLPEDKDPAKVAQNTAGTQESGAFYAAALGNIALQLQNVVISDPNWFATLTGGQELNLAAMNIRAEGLPADVKSHICPTGTATEWMHISWIDGRDADGQFALKGIGDNGASFMSTLRARVSSDQLGTALGNNRLAMSNDTTTAIPGDCGTLDIPVGAPVIAFKIDTPATPTTTLSRTEYRSVDCNPAGTAEADKTMTGTKVQKRVVNYDSAGAMTVTVGGAQVPFSATAGWQDDAMGECINAVRIAATTQEATTGAGASLDTFASMALRDVLNSQIRTMDCRKSTVDAKNVGREGQAVGGTLQKNIDTCGDGTIVTGQGMANENGSGRDNDEKILRCDTTINNNIGSPFVGLNNVQYPTSLVWTGTAILVRDRNAKTIGADGNQVQITRWIGKSPNGVFCDAKDSFYANCQQINGAPDLLPYQSNRFNELLVPVDRTPMSVSSSHYVLYNDYCPGDVCMGTYPGFMGDLMAQVPGGDFVFFRGDGLGSMGENMDCGFGGDLWGADCLHSTWIKATVANPNHFADVTATITGGVNGEKLMEAREWSDPILFKPKTTKNTGWDLTSVQCEWSKREPVADCPALMASDSRQGNWNPSVLASEGVFLKAMSGPGISYPLIQDSEIHSGAPYSAGVYDRQVPIIAHLRNTVQTEYNKRLAAGEFVAEISRPYQRWFDCNYLGLSPGGCKWQFSTTQCPWYTLFTCLRPDGGHYTMTGNIHIGPGKDTKYLKAWRSGKTQTTLLNTDGIRTRTYATEYEPNKVRVEQASGWAKYLEPVHCGKGEVVSETRYRTWTTSTPVYGTRFVCDVWFIVCLLGHNETYVVRYDTTTHTQPITISGQWIQEWRSDLGWSKKVEQYTSSPNMGTWTRYSDIPASF